MGLETHISSYIMGFLTILLGLLGLYNRGQKHKIQALSKDIDILKSKENMLKEQVKEAEARAELHKDIAFKVVSGKEITETHVKQMQDKVDELKNREHFSIDL